MVPTFVIRMSFPVLMERYPRGKDATKPEMIMKAAAKPARESEYPLEHNIWERVSN